MEIAEVKYRGISRSLSDMAVNDGGCAESVNVIVDDGEITPIVPPEIIEGMPDHIKYDLLFVHDMGDEKKYICLMGDGKHLGYVSGETSVSSICLLDPDEKVLDVKSIGHTLIVNTDQRMFYILYSAGRYSFLGEKPPELDIEIKENYESVTNDKSLGFQVIDVLDQAGVDYSKRYLDELYSDNPSVLNPFYVIVNPVPGSPSITEPGYHLDFNKDFFEENSPNSVSFSNTYQRAKELFSKIVWDKISLLNNTLSNNNIHSLPFFIRHAYKLYDGSYWLQSSPILAGASLPSNNYFVHATKYSRNSYRISLQKSFSIQGIFLNYNATELEKWKDLVVSVEIFVSERINPVPYGTFIGKINNGTCSFEEVSDEKILEEVLSKSNFYKVKEIRIDDILESGSAEIDLGLDECIRFGDSLATKDRLDDDFGSHDSYMPSLMHTYNNRLSMANIKVRHYDGPPRLNSLLVLPASAAEDSVEQWDFYYFIKSENGRGDLVTMRAYEVLTDAEGKTSSSPGPWHSYPDVNCYRILAVNRTANKQYRISMLPHPFLNCAYAFLGFAQGVEGLPSSSFSSAPELDGTESIASSLYQSETSNPFIFPASGVQTVPANRIIGMATITQAISQGQFGQYLMYVFADNGIWAMKTGDTGEFVTLNPLSRDVCINGRSITGIDNAVVFISKRGAMLISGSQIVCISENMTGEHFDIGDIRGSLQLMQETCKASWGSDIPGLVSDGLSFIDYARDCHIAYDYAKQRLVFIRENSDYQYVYSLLSNTWHKMCFGMSFKKVVNDYPNYVLQEETGSLNVLRRFSELQDVNGMSERIFGVMVSRQMDFGKPEILKTVHKLYNRGIYDKSMLKCLLYGSRDGMHFYNVRSLKGKSFKTYRIVLFMNFLPRERLNRTTFVFEERWTNKAR